MAQGQADPQLPRGPRCAVGRRTRCRTHAGKGGAPAGSGRSPYECQTTLQEHQDSADQCSRNDDHFFVKTSPGTLVQCTEHFCLVFNDINSVFINEVIDKFGFALGSIMT